VGVCHHRTGGSTFVIVSHTHFEIKNGLANVGWAYAVADVAVTSLFCSDFISTCLSKENDFSKENHCKLLQRQLWLE
jgi:hypothetical protein